MLLDDATITIETEEVKLSIDEQTEANLILDEISEIFVTIDNDIALFNLTIDTSDIKLIVEDLPDLNFSLDASPDVIILAAGNIGTQGPEGEKGDQGQPGDTGPRGIAGPKGADSTVPGPPGSTGPQGVKGDTGATGAASTVPGPPGAVGPAGSQGVKGDTGATGPGVPPGGTTGQLLTKTSSADYASAWQPAPVVGADLVYNGQFPSGGPNYTDGDIVIGDDGVLYICVMPTTLPPTAWPGGPAVSKTFIFTQGSPLSVWVIPHNLNKYPSIEVVDTGDSVVIPSVHYDSPNQITATFGSATSGKAYLN